MIISRRYLAGILGALYILSPAIGRAGTHIWTGSSGGEWTNPNRWSAGNVPTGADPTAILVFENLSAVALTNNLPTVPALINQLVFDSDVDGLVSMVGNPIALGGNGAKIEQRSIGGYRLYMPLVLRAPLALTGDGLGTVYLTVPSGLSDIRKSGNNTFAFEYPSFAPPPTSGWFGGLTIDQGTIIGTPLTGRNPVTLTGPGAILTSASRLATGVLNGPSGLVESRSPFVENEDIIIRAISDGTFGGTLRLAPGSGNDNNGKLIILGAARQTLTGDFVSPDSPGGANALQIQKDVQVGYGATLSLAGNASLTQQAAGGAILLSGGTFELNNTGTNLPSRLRDGDAGSTGIDSTGGGLFSFIGNPLGSTELVSRLQLGSPTRARSGALTLQVVHTAGSVDATQLSIQSLSRDGFVPTFATVDFRAINSAGEKLPLGGAGASPRISFVTPPPLANGLLRNTRNFDATTVGWATVNGSAFATYGPNGIAPVALGPVPDSTSQGSASTNTEIRGNFTASNPVGYYLNSLRLEPTEAGQSFTAGSYLNTNAILLAGPRDYTITGGILRGASGSEVGAPRYVHVESASLTIDSRIDPLGGNSGMLVKAGEGTLVLTRNHDALNVVLNAGILRVDTQSQLTGHYLSFRGGVLEVLGGGTFKKQVNWSASAEDSADEDAGSGGFAAVGAPVTLDLNGTGPNQFQWGRPGFIREGHALLFGTKNADQGITWSDNLILGTATSIIRVLDNPGSALDMARVSGSIAGGREDDLLKTGPGLLELTGVNTYLGATLIHQGTMRVIEPGTIASSTLTEVHPGATLGGDGEVGRVRVLDGGRLAPGNDSTGTAVLSLGDFTMQGGGARFEVQLAGSTAGTGFDQLEIKGGVTLNGGSLQGSLLNGFSPQLDQLFFILLNDDTDPISGQFAQGGAVRFGEIDFSISYTGNSEAGSFTGGNDVVLRAIPEPSVGLTALAGALLLTRSRAGRARGTPRSVIAVV